MHNEEEDRIEGWERPKNKNYYDEYNDNECGICGMEGAEKVNNKNFGWNYLCSRCAMINDPDNDPLHML